MKRKFLTDPLTSARMQKVKSKSTSLEKKMAELIHKSGLKYRSQPKLFGKPDFRIIGTKILIFCDSSFWHGRRKNEINGNAFNRNRDLWVTKLKRNKARATKVNKHLTSKGWITLRFWDDDITKNPINVIWRIINATKANK